jgi:hypothetical protein
VQDTSVIIFIAATKEEVIGATLGAKMTAGKEIRTLLADVLKADRAFAQSFDLFGHRTMHTGQCNRHKPIIRKVSRVARV